MAEPIPALPDQCWPVDWPDTADVAALSDEVKARAGAVAVATLRSLTAYQVGGCPVTVTPARHAPTDRTWPATSGYERPWYVGLESGSWVNRGCGCVLPMDSVTLPGPVGVVQEVRVEGNVVDPSAYRVIGNRLIRTDGGSWPSCQFDFTVVYTQGGPVDGLAAYAAGVLAAELAKALTGGKCRLPANTTSATRGGITIDLAATLPRGRTGLREVDMWVESVNPNGLSSAPAVYSPDLPRYV